VTPRHFTPYEYTPLSQMVIKFPSSAPQPEFLALHRSIAHILEESGAGVAIDKTFDRARKIGRNILAGQTEVMAIVKGLIVSGDYEENSKQTELEESTRLRRTM
jgi:hypothetical protein